MTAFREFTDTLSLLATGPSVQAGKEAVAAERVPPNGTGLSTARLLAVGSPVAEGKSASSSRRLSRPDPGVGANDAAAQREKETLVAAAPPPPSLPPRNPGDPGPHRDEEPQPDGEPEPSSPHPSGRNRGAGEAAPPRWQDFVAGRVLPETEVPWRDETDYNFYQQPELGGGVFPQMAQENFNLVTQLIQTQEEGLSFAGKTALVLGFGRNVAELEAAANSGFDQVLGVEPVGERVQGAATRLLEMGQNPARFKLHHQSMNQMASVAGDSADLVVGWDIFPPHAETARAAQEIYRVLAPGGYAYLNYPNPEFQKQFAQQGGEVLFTKGGVLIRKPKGETAQAEQVANSHAQVVENGKVAQKSERILAELQRAAHDYALGALRQEEIDPSLDLLLGQLAALIPDRDQARDLLLDKLNLTLPRERMVRTRILANLSKHFPTPPEQQPLIPVPPQLAPELAAPDFSVTATTPLEDIRLGEQPVTELLPEVLGTGHWAEVTKAAKPQVVDVQRVLPLVLRTIANRFLLIPLPVSSEQVAAQKATIQQSLDYSQTLFSLAHQLPSISQLPETLSGKALETLARDITTVRAKLAAVKEDSSFVTEAAQALGYLDWILESVIKPAQSRQAPVQKV